MKSLKKLAAFAAIISAMNFAKAESKEVQYGPTDYEGGEIDKIELVNVADAQGENTHLLVRSNGKFKTFGMPYAYTGTNVQDFASRSFAQGGATNVNQYVVTDNGKVYMTFNWTNGVYTTQINSKSGPGVVKTDIPEIDETTGKPKKDENGKDIIAEYAINEVENPEQDPIAKAVLAASNSGSPVALNGQEAYYFAQDAQGKWALYNNGEKATGDFIGGTGMGADGAVPEQMVFVNADATGYQKILYVLAEDRNGVKRIYTADGSLNRKTADFLNVTDDGKLVYQDSTTKKVRVYNPAAAGQAKEKVVNTSAIPADAKSVVVSGNNIYYATAKKLGVRTID